RPPRERGVERAAGGREPGPVPRPPPRAAAGGAPPARDPADGEQPGEEVEAVRPRHAEYGWPEHLHERVLDLALRPALRDPRADVRLDLLGGGRVRLVERRVAGRADGLGLHLALGPMLVAPERRRSQHQGGQDGDEESHAANACRIPWSISAFVAGPTMCPTSATGTTRPRRSMKNVSG